MANIIHRPTCLNEHFLYLRYMKKIVIVAVFIFLINKTFSQKYQPFDSTTVWATGYNYKYNNCYINEDLKYFSKGYELNNGNVWLKIHSSRKSWLVGQHSSCQAPPSFATGFLGYLFNDTINKRVFFRSGALPPNHIPLNNNSWTNELIYDFNKTVGDSMFVSPFYNTHFKILSIDSILFSGKYHKRFLATISPPSGLIPKISLLEGIGSSIDPFTPYKANGFESGSALLCFASPTQSISVTSHTVFTNGNVNGSCANLSMINVNVKEIEKFDLSIYPNPASDHISVILEQNSAVGTNYKVVNLLGQEQLTGTLKETKNDIDLVNLRGGIYFVNFYKNDRFVLCKKIVIQ
jgi:hypothetical protein